MPRALGARGPIFGGFWLLTPDIVDLRRFMPIRAIFSHIRATMRQVGLSPDFPQHSDCLILNSSHDP